MGVGPIQLIESLNRTNKNRKNSLLLPVFEWGLGSSLAFTIGPGLKLLPLTLLVLRPSDLV